MIVWGEHDGIIPIEHAYAAHELIPASRLEIIEGAGHFVHVEQPDTFADLLIDFIESTEPASMRLEALRDALLKGS